MKEPIKSIFVLKDLRTRTNKTQRDIANILNVRSQTISDWERGLKEPKLSPRQMLMLCNAYECTLEELSDALDQTAVMTEVQPQTTLNNHRVLVAN